jgi:RimJ/RimL family protein N-acetyltransferase
VAFDESWLETTAQWLSDPHLADLIRSGPVDPEQQRAWYATLATRSDYAIWGIEHDGERVGVMGLKHLDAGDGGAEYFMYLGDTRSWGRGIGRWATAEIADEARSRGLTHIWGLVGTHNPHSRDVHVHLGFQVEGERDGHWLLVMRL